MTATATTGTAVAGAAGKHGARDPLTWLVAAAVSLPLVVAAVVAVRSDWVASSDWALLELRIRDVGSGDTPLTGPYSRYDWYHPGPAMFWLLAPVYRLAGSDAGAMYAAAAVLNIVAVVGACVVARRLGGRPLLVVVGVVLAIAAAGGASEYADPWNPYLIVLPLVLFLLAAAAMAAGDPWALPVAVAAGAFVVQSHVGNAVVVAAVGIAAVVSLAVVRRRHAPTDGGLPVARRWAVAGVSAAVVVAMWSAPVVQQITGDPGNLGEIAAYFTSEPDEPAAGLSELPTVLGLELGPLAPWMGVEEPVDRASQLDDTSGWWALPLLAGLAVAVVVGWRRRHRGVLALTGMAIVATAAGALATTRITGITYPYLLRFWWATAMVGWMAVLWAAWSAQPPRWVAWRRRLPGRVLVVAAIAVVAVPALVAVARVAPGPPDDPNRTAAGALAPGVLAGIEPGAAYAVVPNGQSWGEPLAAVVNLLAANGHPVATHPYFVTEYGERLTFGDPGAPDTFAGRLIVATNEGIAEFDGRAGLRVLARWDPLSPEERREMSALRDVVAGQFTAAGRPDLADAVRRGALGRTVDLGGGVLPDGVDPDVVDRIATLEERGIPVVVFLDPTPVGTDDLL